MHLDLLCLGLACYDLIFTVDHHPGADEKTRAESFLSCGGGLAANAAMTAGKLGYNVALISRVGRDIYGDQHIAELQSAGVQTDAIVRGEDPTSISAIIVKPDGARTIVNYTQVTHQLTAGEIDLSQFQPKAILLDGHHLELAVPLAQSARQQGIPTVLDADSVKTGSQELLHLCDYVVASERFALQHNGSPSPEVGLAHLATIAPNVVVTLGEKGVIWQRGKRSGAMPSFDVDVVDTTGAGDAYHGAFAAGLAVGMDWHDLLRYASAVGALCCTKYGARIGIPSVHEVEALLG